MRRKPLHKHKDIHTCEISLSTYTVREAQCVPNHQQFWGASPTTENIHIFFVLVHVFTSLWFTRTT